MENKLKMCFLQSRSRKVLNFCGRVTAQSKSNRFWPNGKNLASLKNESKFDVNKIEIEI